MNKIGDSPNQQLFPQVAPPNWGQQYMWRHYQQHILMHPIILIRPIHMHTRAQPLLWIQYSLTAYVTLLYQILRYFTSYCVIFNYFLHTTFVRSDRPYLHLATVKGSHVQNSLRNRNANVIII
jgi:hypothetical protein